MQTGIESLENIIFLVENNGYLSLGRAGPARCAAVACDEHNQLAAVVRRQDESISCLLGRLDKAIENAWNKDEYIDEINE